MNAEDVVRSAMARCGEFGVTHEPVRAVCYRRIGLRQQQIFSKAAEVDAEFFGACLQAGLDPNGAVDLRDAVPPSVYAVERVERVTVDDPGTSAWTPGTRIHLVPVNDADDAAFPPRMTLRDGVLRQVGADLSNVVSVEVHYARLSAPLGATDGETDIELPEPWAELLVLHLSIDLIRKALDLDAAARTAAIDLLAAEEAELAADFTAHVTAYSTRTRRHG